MKINYIEDPELEFGQGNHICPRAGIREYDVYDTRMEVRRDKVYVGAIGTSENIEKLHSWLDRCSRYIPARESNNPNLFPAFCGFNRDYGFRAVIGVSDEITRRINNRDITRLMSNEDRKVLVEEAIDLFYQQVEFLTQNKTVDVIVCVIPNQLFDKISTQIFAKSEETDELNATELEIELNFRRALKAKVMHLGKPIQLVRESSIENNPRGSQDDATRAWNFCTALYYKANQTVIWRMIRNTNRPPVCYVGIGFYRSRDRNTLHTSLAQLFDELGQGVILRGTPVRENKEDRRPHLTDEQSFTLLKAALSEYAKALSGIPGRVVIHKSSNFTDAEKDGFAEAIDEFRIPSSDFVTILNDTKYRLLRNGEYPTYRGTHLEIDKTTHLLYTKGSVEYYRTYPGLYIPEPLEIRIAESDESPGTICREILSLTKMNWNNTQFDGKYPITLGCARKVGEILKYLGENEHPQIRYSFYM